MFKLTEQLPKSKTGAKIYFSLNSLSYNLFSKNYQTKEKSRAKLGTNKVHFLYSPYFGANMIGRTGLEQLHGDHEKQLKS